jgi:hypothetical protein
MRFGRFPDGVVDEIAHGLIAEFRFEVAHEHLSA